MNFNLICENFNFELQFKSDIIPIRLIQLWNQIQNQKEDREEEEDR